MLYLFFSIIDLTFKMLFRTSTDHSTKYMVCPSIEKVSFENTFSKMHSYFELIRLKCFGIIILKFVKFKKVLFF